MNPEFFSELERFKRMLYSNIGPKKSCNEGEYVTGDGKSDFKFELIVAIFLLWWETRKVLLAGG